MQDHKIDETYNQFLRLQQKPDNSAKEHYGHLKIRLNNLVTARREISDNLLHLTFLDNERLPPQVSQIMRTHTHETDTIFWTNLEKRCDSTAVNRPAAEKKRERDGYCYNCDDPDHFANLCPLPYNAENRAKNQRTNEAQDTSTAADTSTRPFTEGGRSGYNGGKGGRGG